MTSCLEHLVAIKRLPGSKADLIKVEYSDVCANVHVQNAFKAYDRTETRLDKFWRDACSLVHKPCENLLVLANLVCIFSHGNAILERGFSVNDQLLVENLSEESLVAQRRIHDKVTYVGGVEKIEITKALVLSMRNGHSRYRDALRSKKEREGKESAKESIKRSRDAAVKELEAKKLACLANAAATAAEIDDAIAELRN